MPPIISINALNLLPGDLDLQSPPISTEKHRVFCATSTRPSVLSFCISVTHMPQHWPAAINQPVSSSPLCPLRLGVHRLYCFFIQPAQAHIDSSRTPSRNHPAFQSAGEWNPGPALFIVFRPMWVPGFIPGIKLSMERTYSASNNLPSPYFASLRFTSLKLLCWERETYELLVALSIPARSQTSPEISLGIRFLYLGAYSKVSVHPTVSVSLRTFSLRVSFPGLGRNAEHVAGDSSQALSYSPVNYLLMMFECELPSVSLSLCRETFTLLLGMKSEYYYKCRAWHGEGLDSCLGR